MIRVGFRHTEGVIFHNDVLVQVECCYPGLSDTTGCLAVVSHANVVENVEPGGALQLRLYGGVWPQDRKIDPSAD